MNPHVLDVLSFLSVKFFKLFFKHVGSMAVAAPSVAGLACNGVV